MGLLRKGGQKHPWLPALAWHGVYGVAQHDLYRFGEQVLLINSDVARAPRFADMVGQWGNQIAYGCNDAVLSHSLSQHAPEGVNLVVFYQGHIILHQLLISLCDWRGAGASLRQHVN